MSIYDAAAVARLEKVYSSPQIVEQRRGLRDIVAAAPGEVGLDVGCGVGFLASELAEDVAPGGKIVAIDNSEDCIEASKVRVAERNVEQMVELRLGDAADLPFADESFDFVVGAQVYCYIPEIAHAISEAARVLKKGGRLVVLDSDWDMCIWECRDRALTRRVVAAHAAGQFAHANLPRELHGLMRDAGLRLRQARVLHLVETKYDPDSFGANLIESVCKRALANDVPAAEVSRWESDLRSRVSDGEWFFCLDRFVFVASK